MKKTLFSLSSWFLLLTVIFLVRPDLTIAKITAFDDADCDTFGNISGTLPTKVLAGKVEPFIFTIQNMNANSEYKVILYTPPELIQNSPAIAQATTDSNGSATFTIDDERAFKPIKSNLSLYLEGPMGSSTDQGCLLHEYSVDSSGTCTVDYIMQERPNSTQACFFNPTDRANSCLDTQSSSGQTITIKVSNIKRGQSVIDNDDFTVRISGLPTEDKAGTVRSGNLTTTHNLPAEGTYTIRVYPSRLLAAGIDSWCSLTDVKIVSNCGDLCLSEEPDTENPKIDEMEPFALCNQIQDPVLQDKCRTCATGGEGGEAEQGGVWTAVGCISRDPVKITERLIQVGLGIGGGVALIMTLAGGFILSTSQGDPQKANQAKEMITNSVIGLLFVIFSVFILQFIGVTILNIPGFGGS